MEFCNDCRKMVYVRTITDENNDTNYEVCAKCGNDNFGAVLDFRKSPNITNHLITTNMNDFTTIPTTTFNALRNEAMEAIRHDFDNATTYVEQAKCIERAMEAGLEDYFINQLQSDIQIS